jgi:hypothetical protein
MRTKQEVVAFLESKLGTKIPCPGSPSLDGMCVTLIKVLMEFLGVPDPYKARGHAATVINAYLSEGIAEPGLGFLSVFSNKNMASPYGHIWVNAGDGAGEFYESNGAKPLITTKGKTYPYDNVCNFDKYIKESMNELLVYLGVSNETEAKTKLKEHLGENNQKCDWGNDSDNRGGFLGSERRKTKSQAKAIQELQLVIVTLEKKIADQPIITPTEPNVKWVENGKSVTTEENGVKTTINYAVKQ